MRTAIYLPALAALASASPLVASPLLARQDIDIEALKAAEDPVLVTVTAGTPETTVAYNLASATAQAVEDGAELDKRTNVAVVPSPLFALEKRAACDPQRAGHGPSVSPDTPEAFLALSEFKSTAEGATVPTGYKQTFKNLKASNSAYGYMGYTELESYDTGLCASKCDAITGCSGINIYFEREPLEEPGTGCEDPDSTTKIKCVFWGGYVAEESANNNGQWRDQFHVVIAGSNGYMKTAVPKVDGYSGVSLGNAAIQAPLDNNKEDTYLGVRILSRSYFDPNLCKAACEAYNDEVTANHPAGSNPKTCQFFTSYLAALNGRPEGQVCALYNKGWDRSFATNVGQYRGEDHATIGYSFAYWNNANPGFPEYKQ
jgi:hypothetical protein